MQVNNKKRTTTNIIASIALALIVVFICVFSYKISNFNSSNKTLCIEFNGKKITEIDGKSVDLNKNMTFTLKNGSEYNTLCIKDGKIACIDANCHDKICVKKGYIDGTHDNDIIACAPHKLVISFE